MTFSVPFRIDEERTYQDTGFVCCIVDIGADIRVEGILPLLGILGYIVVKLVCKTGDAVSLNHSKVAGFEIEFLHPGR